MRGFLAIFAGAHEVRMDRRRADFPARLRRDANERLDAGLDEAVHAAPRELAGLLVERLHLVALLKVFYHRLIVDVSLLVGLVLLTLLRFSAAAQARIRRHAMPRDGESGTARVGKL